jgi:putative transcriptional regulator
MSENAPSRGKLLVARPHLLDPNFARTVVLLCEHDDAKGSLGFVLNRPTDKGLDEVLQGEHDFAGRVDPVFLGGPVGMEGLAVLHPFSAVPGAVEILPGVALGGEATDLGKRLSESRTAPSEVRFLVGYAGWGEGQLKAEMEQESWVVAPGRAELIFSDPAALWRRALRDLGGPWSMLANAPSDPSLN